MKTFLGALSSPPYFKGNNIKLSISPTLTFSPTLIEIGETLPTNWSAFTEDGNDYFPVGDVTSPGSDFKAIAHWAEPGWEDYQNGETITLLLAADHLYGIEKVEFFANGGTAAIATAQNADGFYEAQVILPSSGEHTIEIRAKIYPAGPGKITVMQGAIDPLTALSSEDIGGYNETRGELYGNDIRSFVAYAGRTITEYTVSNFADLVTKMAEAVAKTEAETPVFKLAAGSYDLWGTSGSDLSNGHVSYNRMWTITKQDGLSDTDVIFHNNLNAVNTSSELCSFPVRPPMLKIKDIKLYSTNVARPQNVSNTNIDFELQGDGITYIAGPYTSNNNYLKAYIGVNRLEVDSATNIAKLYFEQWNTSGDYVDGSVSSKAWDLFDTFSNPVITFNNGTSTVDLQANDASLDAVNGVLTWTNVSSLVTLITNAATVGGKQRMTNVTFTNINKPYSPNFSKMPFVDEAKLFLDNITYDSNAVWSTGPRTIPNDSSSWGSYPQPNSNWYAVYYESPIIGNKKATWTKNSTFINCPAVDSFTAGSVNSGLSICSGVNYTNAAGDVFSNAQMVFNCSVSNLNGRNSSLHTDLYQLYSNQAKNQCSQVLLYNLNGWFPFEGSGQGVFSSGMGGTPLTQMMIRNCRIRNQVGAHKFSNVSVKNMAVVDSQFYYGGNTFANSSQQINFSINSYCQDGATYLTNPLVFGNGTTVGGIDDPLTVWINAGGTSTVEVNPSNAALIPYEGTDNFYVVGSSSELLQF